MWANEQIMQSAGTAHAAALPDKGEDRAMLAFWETDNHFTCPLIGICLTFAEQKQILKKSGISVKDRSAFDVHELLVASAGGENRLSRRVDALLRRKYGKMARGLTGSDQETLMAQWQAAYDSGDYAQAFYAVAVRPDLSADRKKKVFGDVHMAMHWGALERLEMKQKKILHQEALASMSDKLREMTLKWRSTNKTNEDLRSKEASVSRKLAAALVKIEDLEAARAMSPEQQRTDAAETEKRALEMRLQVLSEAVGKAEKRQRALEKENRRLQEALERGNSSYRRLKKEMKAIIAEMSALSCCSKQCPSFDLCRKRILIVGGISRMESLYRELIEGSGGIFEYHDGHMKKGARQLENSLRRADMVLCPVNCNSHAACALVKNLAKKHEKPVYMLANSSLKVVTDIIRGRGRQQPSIN